MAFIGNIDSDYPNSFDDRRLLTGYNNILATGPVEVTYLSCKPLGDRNELEGASECLGNIYY